MAEKSFLQKRREFNKILKDIKSVKIQGARNVARAALKAYYIIPTKNSKKKLLASRPTEPMMENVLELAGEIDKKIILNHFYEAQEEINKSMHKLLNKKEVIFTHCHSTNVLKALIYSHKKGKNFKVFNTEARPLLQGRKTAKDLKKAKIPVKIFIDSATNLILSEKRRGKKITKVFLGADALIKKGIINKIGSEMIAIMAKKEKVPVYIVADSWKFTTEGVPIEQRDLNEVWDRAPNRIKVGNPAFEFVDKKYITGIITEYGLMKYSDFVKFMMKG